MANHEILRESDKVSLEHENAANDSVFAKIAREAYVIGVGTVGGAVKEGFSAAADDPVGTSVKLGTAVSLGLVLGYAQRGAGLVRLGGQALGAAMGISFMTDVIAPKRWEDVKSILSDTWNNNGSLEHNTTRMQHNLGHFAFDTGMMLAGGVAGAKIGQRLPSFRVSEAGTFAAGSPMATRLAEVEPGLMSERRFRADVKVGEKSVWDSAAEIVKPGKKTWRLEEAMEMFKATQVAKDGPALALRGNVETIAREGQAIKGEMSRMTLELQAKRAELKAIEELKVETQRVEREKSVVEGLKEQSRKLPELEARLKEVTEKVQAQQKAAQDAKKTEGSGEGKKGKGDAKAEAGESLTDLKTQQRELREEIQKIKQDTNEANPESMINRARVRQAEAEAALKAAEGARPERMRALSEEISAGEKAIETKKGEHDAKAELLRDAIRQYETRVAEVTADMSKIQEAPQTAKPEVKPARKTETGEARGDKTAAEPAATAAAKTEVKAEKPVEKPVEKPAEVVKSPEMLAMEKAESTLKTAKDAVVERAQKVEMMEAAKALKQEAIRERQEIESGKRTFETEKAKEEALEAIKVKEAKANADLAKVGKVQYFRPLNLVNEYAKAAEGYLAAEPSMAKRDAFVRDAVKNIEEMMSGIPNSFKGANGDKGIPSQGRGLNSERRLAQLREHLDNRLQKMNTDHASEVKSAAEQPMVTEAFAKVKSGELKGVMAEMAESIIARGMPKAQRDRVVAETAQKLYENSTIAFFENGKLVQNKGSDGNLYPQFFDLARYEAGQGRLDRLIGHTVDGYAVIAPKLRSDGRLIEIPARGGRAADKPTYAKEVVTTGGVVPEGVGQRTSFGEILKRFRGLPEVKVEQAAAKPAESTTAQVETKPEGGN